MAAWRPRLDQVEVGEALTLIVAWRGREGVEAREIRVGDDALDALREACERTLDAFRAAEAVPFGPDVLIDPGEYLAVPRDVVSHGRTDVLDVLEAGPALETLDPREIPRIWFYAALIGDVPSERVAFVRKANPHVTARTGRFFGTLGETLTKVDEPIFAIDEEFDLVVFPRGIAVLRSTAFETLFRYADDMLDRVDEWATAITDHLPMDDNSAATLIARAKLNTRLASRMRSIYERGHLAGISVMQLRAAAREQGLDETELFDGEQLVVTDDTDTVTLLRLLNEDLFMGGLTGTAFSADRKRTR